jgi:hypothetical protein
MVVEIYRHTNMYQLVYGSNLVHLPYANLIHCKEHKNTLAGILFVDKSRNTAEFFSFIPPGVLYKNIY